MDIAEQFLVHCKEQRINPDALLQFGRAALRPTTPRENTQQHGQVVGEAEESKMVDEGTHAVLGSSISTNVPPSMEMVVLACGCFWGAEKGFWRLPGVCCTEVGYAGGSEQESGEPTYELVCAGLTGHTEAVRIVYDPVVIAFADIMRWFWQCHDVTQADGQGNDRGSQYRSAIYYTSNEQLLAVEATRSAYQRMLRANGVPRPLVTEVAPLASFHRAEPSHQQYLAKPGARPYCSARPLMLLWSDTDWREAVLSLPPELAPRLGDAFWRAHAPKHHCALTLPHEQIIWDDVPSPMLHDHAPRSPPPAPVQGSEELMAPKANGTCDRAVQRQLRWGCDHATADRICCFNRQFAERRGYWESTRLKSMPSSVEPSCSPTEASTLITFFDSVHGLPCYQIGGAGRSWDEFERESRSHGWPSFRDDEVDWQHVRILPDGEVVSVRGAHLGHNLADAHGNRHCINLVSVAGRPKAPQAATAATTAAAVSSQMATPPFGETLSAGSSTGKRDSLGSFGACNFAPTSSDSTIAEGPWVDLPPVAIVPLGGEATVVGHEHHCAAEGIAQVVRSRLGPRAVVVDDWHAHVSAMVILFIVEVESDGTSCDGARKFLRRLTRSPATVFGAVDLSTKAIGVLALARSVCAFSAASGGSDKYAGAAKLQARLVGAGCELLVPMGTSEVELEDVDVAVLPWVDASGRAFEQRLAHRIEILGGGPPAAASVAAETVPLSCAGAADGAAAEPNGCETEATDRSAINAASGPMMPTRGTSRRLLLAALLGAGSLLVLRACRR